MRTYLIHSPVRDGDTSRDSSCKFVYTVQGYGGTY